MVLFMVERNYAESFEAGTDGTAAIVAVNDDVGVRWVYSFLSVDKRKTYCLYEAESEDAIIEAARRSNVPADVIIRVDQFQPEAFLAAP